MAHVKGILLLYPSSLSQSPAAVHGQWAHAQLQPVLRSWRCKEWFGAALRPPCTGERVLAATCTTRNTRECPFLPLVLSSLTVILCLSHMLSGRGEKQPRSHCSFTRPSSRRLQAGGGTGGGRRGACGDGWVAGGVGRNTITHDSRVLYSRSPVLPMQCARREYLAVVAFSRRSHAKRDSPLPDTITGQWVAPA